MTRGWRGSLSAGSRRRRFLAPVALAGLAWWSAPAAAGAAADEARPPNIVFILADDLGIGDLGCYNPESKVPTPHLDRLAAAGMRFTDMHSPSAVCTPTRYGVLTGRYAWRTRLKSGVLYGYSPALVEPERLTWASLLHGRGYYTGCVGKWHLGLGKEKKTDYGKALRPGPLDCGFDYFYGIPASLDMDPYVFVEDDKVVEAPTGKVEKSGHRRQGGGGFWRGGAAAPGFRHIDVLPVSSQKALEFMAKAQKRPRRNPFFLYLPLSAPHTPWLPTEEFRGKSQAGYYGDFVAQVDGVVGEVLAAIEKAKLTENTLVMVSSDNGSHWPVGDIKKYGHRANLGYRGQKADIHEGGHRVPFIARWPGKVPAGSTSDETLCLTDLMATTAALLGETLPDAAAEDSFNFLPVLLGDPGSGRQAGKPVRTEVVHHSLGGTFAIRQGDWKLVEGLGSGGFTAPRKVKPKEGGPAGQLYHLGEDPAEENNRYQDEPEVVARLSARLDEVRQTGRSRPPTGVWDPLFDGATLKGWKALDFAGHGGVEVEDGHIVIGTGVELSGMVYQGKPPTMNYEITYEGKRVDGYDFWGALTFPVADSHCTFVTGGWGGTVVGISSVDEMDAAQNSTAEFYEFDNNRYYRVKVRVVPGKVEVWIDGRQVVDLETKDRKISMRWGDIEQCVPLGFSTWQTTGAIRDVRIRRLAE